MAAIWLMEQVGARKVFRCISVALTKWVSAAFWLMEKVGARRVFRCIPVALTK